MDANDFSGLVEPEAAEPADLARLTTLADELLALRADVAAADEALKRAKATERAMSEGTIPTLMSRLGVRKYELADGTAIEVEMVPTCSISGPKKGPAIEWLDANGHGGLVKTEVSVRLPRDARASVAELVADLQARNLGDVECDAWVEPGTLKSHLKELRAAGIPFPEDLFGWYEVTRTIVTGADGKRSK